MTEYNPDTYYRFNPFIRDWVATCGVMEACHELSCFWVLDIIASYSPNESIRKADYLKIVKVTLNQGKPGCVFTIEDEINGELIRQDIEFTDLASDLKFWAISENGLTVVLLPSEY